MRWFGILLLSLLPVCVSAREIKFKEISQELVAGERVVIVGTRGSVRLKTGTGPLIVRARKTLNEKVGTSSHFETMSFNLRRENGVVYVSTKDQTKAEDLISALQPGVDLHFEIELPPVPCHVIWREGLVQAQQFKSPLSVSLIEGSARIQGSEGPLDVSTQRAEIRVENHKGRAELRTYSGKLVAQQLEGDLLVDNFSGDSQVGHVKGSLTWKTYSGAGQVSALQGALDFEILKGTLGVVSSDGAIRGSLEEGSLAATIEGEADVNVTSGAGQVSIKVSAKSGASVKLQTEDGSLTGPEHLNSWKVGTSKMLGGKLQGTQKGSIQVKTKTGPIRLRL